MKWLRCETIEEYNDVNARIEATLGIPNDYFAGYARVPRVIDGVFYLPVTDDAMSALSKNEINDLIDMLPLEVEQ